MKKLFATLSILAFFFPSTVFAAITYDNSGITSFAPGSTSGSLSYTLGSGASLWVCIPQYPGGLPSSVKWNTTESLTNIVSNNQSPTFTEQSYWYIVNPTSGTHNITVTYASGTEFDIGAISFTGTASSPAGATATTGTTPATGTSFTMPITSTTANSYVIDCGTINGSATISSTGSGQVNKVNYLHSEAGGSTWREEISYIPSPSISTYTFGYSWSGTFNYNDAGVEILPSVATPPTVSPFNLIWW